MSASTRWPWLLGSVPLRPQECCCFSTLANPRGSPRPPLDVRTRSPPLKPHLCTQSGSCCAEGTQCSGENRVVENVDLGECKLPPWHLTACLTAPLQRNLAGRHSPWPRFTEGESQLGRSKQLAQLRDSRDSNLTLLGDKSGAPAPVPCCGPKSPACQLPSAASQEGVSCLCSPA